jgi:hypothetical protein
MVDTRVISPQKLAILLFVADSSPRKTMSELAMMYQIL